MIVQPKNKKHNNQISNNNPPPASIRNHLPFRVTTSNAQGLNSPAKQLQVLEFMDLNNIHILGLSETSLPKRQSKLLYKNNSNYKAYFINESSHRGSGVGIIVHNDYAKFIQTYGSYKGRVIYIDLYMQGREKLRVIQVYSHANLSHRKEIEQLHFYVTELLNKSQRQGYKVILMGDLNVSYEEYSIIKRTGKTIPWKFNLIKALDKAKLIDSIPLYHDITASNTYATHFPIDPNKTPSRIDYIWISQDLVEESINSNILSADVYTTDHKVVYVSFWTNNIFQKKSFAKMKQHNIKKRVFLYDSMDEEKWNQFALTTDAYMDSTDLKDMNISNYNGFE